MLPGLQRSGFLPVSRKQRIEEVAVNARLNGRDQRFGSCPVACFPYAAVEAALKPVVADSPAPGTSAGGQPGSGFDHEFGVGFNLKIKHPQANEVRAVGKSVPDSIRSRNRPVSEHFEGDPGGLDALHELDRLLSVMAEQVVVILGVIFRVLFDSAGRTQAYGISGCSPAYADAVAMVVASSRGRRGDPCSGHTNAKHLGTMIAGCGYNQSIADGNVGWLWSIQLLRPGKLGRAARSWKRTHDGIFG